MTARTFERPASAAASERASGSATPASRAIGLKCVECGARGPLAVDVACSECLGPLGVEYDLASLAGWDPREQLPGRPRTIWRYQEILPPVDAGTALNLGPENTPLRPAPRLGAELGLDDLWLKDDSVLPSGSFKDRPASVALAYGDAQGYPAFGCASTGNLAAATARAAARLGKPCLVFVPRGLPPTKLESVRRFGARIVEIDGTYDDANRVASIAGETARIGLANVTLRPYYTEGSKTVLLETLEALEWTPPDAVVVPLGSGALLSATGRAWNQVRELGWSRGSGAHELRVIGSQPEGCAPIVDGFHRSDAVIVPVQHPQTIAESLAIGDPASGPEAIRVMRETGGTADSPTADEVRWAIRMAARREGIWVEPAGGTVISTARRLRAQGTLRRSDRVVLFLTGAGWKVPGIAATEPSADPPLSISSARVDPSELRAWIEGPRAPAGTEGKW